MAAARPGAVVPIFYDREPRKWDDAKLLRAFREMRRDHPRAPNDTVERWRAALSSVSDTSGWVHKSDKASEAQPVDDVIAKLLCQTVPEALAVQVSKIVAACAGLPLTVKVMASHLRTFGNQPDMWEEALVKLGQADKLGAGKEDQLFVRLRISYDHLSKQQKRMFLDVACFFLGWRADTAKLAWLRRSGFAGPNTDLEILASCALLRFMATIRLSDSASDRSTGSLVVLRFMEDYVPLGGLGKCGRGQRI
ncbi:hypothetical protein WJX81_001308 [Elliptochloris bilobata]|uniref:Uncharacterized protein n=1 Tax=Elliptochloris bilobata TaxID=381761 RepID=A0AAW1SEX7_9CHLO